MLFQILDALTAAEPCVYETCEPYDCAALGRISTLRKNLGGIGTVIKIKPGVTFSLNVYRLKKTIRFLPSFLPQYLPFWSFPVIC